MKVMKSFRVKLAVSTAVFFVGVGIALHDFCHHLYELGGYREILGLHGGYLGFALTVLGYALLLLDSIGKYQLYKLLKCSKS